MARKLEKNTRKWDWSLVKSVGKPIIFTYSKLEYNVKKCKESPVKNTINCIFC